MKLTKSGASPYVRKATACAIKRGVKFEDWVIGSADAGLTPFNPLNKVPTLVTDDGVSLFDSPVICEYLDSIGDAPKLFPAAGPARWKALRQQALVVGDKSRRRVKGVLAEANDAAITVTVDGESKTFAYGAIAKARLIPRF